MHYIWKAVTFGTIMGGWELVLKAIGPVTFGSVHGRIHGRILGGFMKVLWFNEGRFPGVHDLFKIRLFEILCGSGSCSDDPSVRPFGFRASPVHALVVNW